MTICRQCKHYRWGEDDADDTDHLCAINVTINAISGNEQGFISCQRHRKSSDPQIDCPDYEQKEAETSGTGSAATDD
jgi:hypothetical protein